MTRRGQCMVSSSRGMKLLNVSLIAMAVALMMSAHITLFGDGKTERWELLLGQNNIGRRGVMTAPVLPLLATVALPLRSKATVGVAESRLLKSLNQLRNMETSIISHRYRQAREELREGSLSHLREDVREAMARHPVSQDQAKAAINSVVLLDSNLRKAERGASVTIFPSLADAVEKLSSIAEALDKDGSLYGEEFTNPALSKKDTLFDTREKNEAYMLSTWHMRAIV
eukprot:CAMPEP_0184482144 /NCGR_PEP_ID=MMETSP0113_2-20130426/3717_1 /TAXON_ID=91329 /ORGANISM="Norrisiella sphaerica, Strain BC52" /LENGTH=227 /DNA_ID=CAMNT_0026861709 /DNA_START=98 /DNA_END=779 /DNA_ORIENTATION=-